MAIKLLSKKLQQSIHIALFLIIVLASLGNMGMAQTVLLPGDMVIVSANADTQSIDFIPLIDIEKGTSVYFSNGMWNDSTQVLTGQELQLRFNENIQAGTNLHVNSLEDPRFNLSGELSFDGGTFRLFTYQKEQGVYRFIYALGWGKGNIWNRNGDTNGGSHIPASLKGYNHSFITLGDASNHQYFVRNGASGTRKLLLKFVSDPSHWRSSDKSPFPIFGTSFNLLTPPVVLFDQSISTVKESDSVAILNVAIYEHDGSRLSVDVVFDSLRSITNTSDFNSYSTKKLNFTGLIGDGMYEVNVPLNDDAMYEGRETGIFTLANLTNGNLGDFLSHSLIVADNEKPEVLISEVVNSSDGQGYVDIKNMEDGVVSLSGWSLESGNQRFVFDDKAVLYPFETIRFIDSSEFAEVDTSAVGIVSTLEEPLLRRNGGSLSLKDYEGNEIFNTEYTRVERASVTNGNREDLLAKKKVKDPVTEQGFEQGASAQQISILQQLSSPGWKVLVNPAGFNEAFPEHELYSWSEDEQKLKIAEVSSIKESENNILFGYFESSELEKISEWQQAESAKKIAIESADLSFTISATDENKNEVVDQLEGLNLVYNNLSESFQVNRFLELISSKLPDQLIAPQVYGIHQNAAGEVNFKPLELSDEIASGAPFWVLLQAHQSAVEVTLDQDQILQPSEELIEEVEVDNEKPGFIGISFASQEHSEVLKIHFVDEGIIRSTKDLNSYPRLFLEQPSFLNVAFTQGEDYFNELTLSSNMEQSLELPVTFSTSTAGKYTFSVVGWEEIPADWEIVVEDVQNEKEYKLRKDFSLTFDHTLPVSKAEAESDSDSKVDENAIENYSTKEKFIIHIRPKGSEAENDEGTDTRPTEVELHQNFPNPFNPATTISFYLPESEEVRLSVFNIVGQPVSVIAEGTMSAGEHQFEWDATDRPSGMYIYQLEVGKNVMTRKMTLVK